YVINSYLSDNQIVFTKDYTKPIEKYINITHNYDTDGKTGRVLIEFENNLNSYKPGIKFNKTKLKCSVYEKFLNCDFTEENFPSKENEIEYKGYLVNPALNNDAEININISPKKSSSSYVGLFKLIMIISISVLI
ncbi:MAG: hypothetical protein MJ252_23605, partial [archaeon]|nr:hypothetical protein [archaeon]